MVALASVGCGIPRDPEGPLDRVRGTTMHEGVKDNPPWVELDELDLEARRYALAERFAAGIEAEIEWIEGSEEELFAALEVHELDLVVGGITSVSPWASVAALTHPYLTTAPWWRCPRDVSPWTTSRASRWASSRAPARGPAAQDRRARHRGRRRRRS